ncbi:phenylacetate--CoA ligase family protein [Mesonia maritima]|uniref:Phenylacetate-CoA ligase n=1 Tax=Mesonia maritima TaxID=1793873 RepID=A0ABU1K7T2_9FLAO|nr:AMP-binding protein [Mesonia maritima]MDR6301661.1 phenylacetate-CoA ligase [Mesonia maritima]
MNNITKHNDWEKKQQILLKKQLKYIAENSPYYQRIFQEKGIEIENFDLKNFQELPVTSKNDLANHNSDFICVPNSEIIDYVTTSGTLGKPVTFALNENDLQRLAKNEENSFQQIGITKNDIVQLTTTLDRQFIAGLAYFLGLRKIGVGIIRLGSGVPELQWNSILEFQPTYLVAVPSFLLKLIDFAEKNNIDCNKTAIKAAICIGEPIRDKNFQLNTLGKKITEKWNIELFSTYASTEMCTAFTECSFHQGNHIQEELIYTEILDENDNPVENEEIGELTITTLGIETMPLLRYKTGDMVRKITEKCKCGKNGNRISTLLGRKKQLIKFKGTSLYPQQIINALTDFEKLQLFLVQVSTNELNTDSLEIIIPQETAQEIQKEIQLHLRAKLRVLPNIILEEEEKIQQQIFNPLSRKPIRFIDKRS